jgi:hypothetical protein
MENYFQSGRANRMVKFMSEADGFTKRFSTVVETEGEFGLRERQPWEPVHWRENQYDPCLWCEESGGVWTDIQENWEHHKMSCCIVQIRMNEIKAKLSTARGISKDTDP